MLRIVALRNGPQSRVAPGASRHLAAGGGADPRVVADLARRQVEPMRR
jgi:hypothetical protein